MRSKSAPFQYRARTTSAPPQQSVRPDLPAETSRSAVTNGTRLLPPSETRLAWSRRVRDLIELHVADLGGRDAVSQAETSIIRRAAVLTVEMERIEAKLAEAEDPAPTTIDLYQRMAGNLRRLLESLGLHRRPANVTPPSLNDRILAASRGRE